MDNITFGDGRAPAAGRVAPDRQSASQYGKRLAGSAAAPGTTPIQITPENARFRTTVSAGFLHAGVNPGGCLHGTR